LTITAVVVAIVAVGFTEWRLWQGMDLADESYYVAVPYRFSVGSRPFVDELGVLQVPTFLVYPFVKPFVELQGGSGDGIMMYTRHLYLLFAIGVAAAVFFALRRRLLWPYALLIAAVYVSYVLFDLTQLSYNTMGAGFLTLGVAFGLLALWRDRDGGEPAGAAGGGTASPAAADAAPSAVGGSVPGGPQIGSPPVMRARTWSWWFAAAGLAHGLAGFAFPTLWALLPLYAVVLAVCVWTEARRLGDQATWRRWLAAAGGYSAAAAIVAVVEVAIVLSFGWENVRRSLHFSFSGAKEIDQVGGLSKLGEILGGFGRFLWSRPYLLIAAVVLVLVYRYAPRLGRGLLVLLPIPLYLAGQRSMLEAAGFVIVLSLLGPYLYLFLPRAVRRPANLLLLWAALPGIAAGLLSGWTSAEGYPHAALGMMPALMASLAFFTWALLGVRAEPATTGLSAAAVGRPEDAAASVGTAAASLGTAAASLGETAARPDETIPHLPAAAEAAGTSRLPFRDAGERVARHGPVLAAVALSAIVAICVVFQFQFIARNVPYGELTAWMDSGPYWGIHTTADRKAYLEEFERTLEANSSPEDRLLVWSQFPGAYLFWPYRTATCSVWIGEGTPESLMPWYLSEWVKRRQTVPTLVVRTRGAGTMTDAEFARAYDVQLMYPIALRRGTYTFLRRPPGFVPPILR
jgi:hypothetical protein